MFVKKFSVVAMILFSFVVYSDEISSSPITQINWQKVTNQSESAKRLHWKNLKHYSRQNHHQFRGSHRQLNRGSNQVYKQQRRVNNTGHLRRGNIYTTPKKIGSQRFKFNGHQKVHYGNYLINNKPLYRYKKYHHPNRYHFRQNRWINNRYYQWYIPGAAYIIYQNQSCYIEGVGEGTIYDNLCCIDSLKICSDQFLFTEYY